MNKIKGFIKGVARSFVIMPHEAYENNRDSLRKNWKVVGKYMRYAIDRQTENVATCKEKIHTPKP